MKNLRKQLQSLILCEKGVTLIHMALLIVVLGLLMAAGMTLHKTWNVYKAGNVTEEKLAYIQTALKTYYSQKGRYPCPASLTTPIDGNEFGQEVLADCTGADMPGTFRADGRDGRKVRTGTVPVRTLGIADEYMFDGYRHRLFYAVTEAYAVDGSTVSGDNGAIFVVDGNPAKNSATATPGSVVQLVYSMGWDNNGVYSMDGVNVQPCDPAARSGENCDFDANATFMNTINASSSENNVFAGKVSYPPSQGTKPCDDPALAAIAPKNTVFLIDTSGSMRHDETSGTDGFQVKCPESMPGCSRMDVARWALRRVIPPRVLDNRGSADPGKTMVTGFALNSAPPPCTGTGCPKRGPAPFTVAGINASAVSAKLTTMNIVFDDPTDPGYITRDNPTINNDLENTLQSLCPLGETPLGIHIKALADSLGNGTPDHPNKITVISDGVSNLGNGDGTGDLYDPLNAAKYIKATYPYLKVDIIDVVGNPSLTPVSVLTGGTYYRTDNPATLLNSLYRSAGICTTTPPTPPVDKRGCGSAGTW